MLAKEDFNNDQKDAGDMGSNHSVTALYEIIPANAMNDEELATVDPLRYQRQKPKKPSASFSDEWMFIKVRYKKPDQHSSNLLEVPVKPGSGDASSNMRFASAVAAFGMVLRNSTFKGHCNYELVKSLATKGLESGSDAYKSEFLELVRKAERLEGNADSVGKR